MARSTDNIVTHGLSRKVDQFVFRQRHGKTVVARVPCKYPPPTAVQELKQNKFKEAIVYAKMILADPHIKQLYKARAKPGQTAHNVAIAEFMRNPGQEQSHEGLF